jgi:hypothetical protein
MNRSTRHCQELTRRSCALGGVSSSLIIECVPFPLTTHRCCCTRALAIWPRFLDYLEVVAKGWQLTLQNADPFRVLDYKLHNTTKALKKWSQKYIGIMRLQLAMTKEVVCRLDQQLDRRRLSLEELTLRSELKVKCLTLASLPLLFGDRGLVGN